ncbi:MAG: hypothetical protein LBW85_09770 [Deltaproteobacteria bacterium]|jgi:hypothetical protein|nr:hypothetical protein [Deltaproteobacteria bacterium]
MADEIRPAADFLAELKAGGTRLPERDEQALLALESDELETAKALVRKYPGRAQEKHLEFLRHDVPQWSEFEQTAFREVGYEHEYGGDVTIIKTKAGGLWLRYHVEYEGFSESGRWFKAPIDREKAEAIQASEALSWLASLDWYFQGGSYFRDVSKNSGPPLAGL